MRARSASTLDLDPYRAGVELADALAPIAPDLVFLFPSIEFHGAEELPQALYDALGNERMILLGCTGEGFLEAHKVADVGACALGINFGGRASIALAVSREDSREALDEALSSLAMELGRKPELLCALADFRCDGTSIELALQRYGVPAIGGFAADDMLEVRYCTLFANRQVLEQGVIFLGFSGEFRWDIHLAHEMEPVGNPGLVTATEGPRLVRIEQQSAMDFVEAAIGRPVSRVDQGIVTFNVVDKEIPGKRYLRSIVTDSEGCDGSFSLFGRIPLHSQVQVCLAQPEAIVKDVYRVAAEASHCGFQPRAALAVSCAGRKHLLGNRIEHEVQAVRESLGEDLALAGFPSFGEFSPVNVQGRYSETYFHNMTYALLLLGE